MHIRREERERESNEEPTTLNLSHVNVFVPEL